MIDIKSQIALVLLVLTPTTIPSFAASILAVPASDRFSVTVAFLTKSDFVTSSVSVPHCPSTSELNTSFLSSSLSLSISKLFVTLLRRYT
nr:MAG TPA: hypothetical protein [Bacteriophage sp.]